jgi:hypothetical protein
MLVPCVIDSGTVWCSISVLEILDYAEHLKRANTLAFFSPQSVAKKERLYNVGTLCQCHKTIVMSLSVALYGAPLVCYKHQTAFEN